MTSTLSTFDDRAIACPQGRCTVRHSGRAGFARFRPLGKLSSLVDGSRLGRPEFQGLPSKLSVGGDNHFCDGSETDLFAHRPRADFTPNPRAVCFRRECGGLSKRGQQCSTRNMSPPAIIFRSPTITVSTAAAALERSAEEILGMVWDGRLRFAWNIARVGETRQEIRILTRSLFDYQNRIAAPAISDEEDFQHAVKTIFPATAQKSVKRPPKSSPARTSSSACKPHGSSYKRTKSFSRPTSITT